MAVMIPLSPPKFMHWNWNPQFPHGYSQVGPSGEFKGAKVMAGSQSSEHALFSSSSFDTVYLVREQEGLPMRPPSLCNCEKFPLSK